MCSFATNIVWWSKPTDISVPTTLEVDCSLETLLLKLGVSVADANVEAVNWKFSPMERFGNLSPNILFDVWSWLPSVVVQPS